MKRSIYLARHGETEYNRLGKITGQLNVPLNENGLEQAMMLAIDLRNVYFDALFSSPLKRCRQTVNEIKKFHKETPLIFDNRLMECGAGVMEGEPRHDKWEYSEKFTPRGGESFFNLRKRVQEFIIQQVLENSFSNMLIVSHGGPIKIIRGFFENTDILSASEMSIKNCNYWIINTDSKSILKTPNKL